MFSLLVLPFLASTPSDIHMPVPPERLHTSLKSVAFSSEQVDA
jgi:hypothetical protein